jgi:hypothetical protein
MKILEALNRRFGRYAIPNLTTILIIIQMFTYGLRSEYSGLPDPAITPAAEIGVMTYDRLSLISIFRALAS